MAVVDAIVRLIPGVLEKEEATKLESFSEAKLEHPQYTRPEKYKNWPVPAVLLSGDHQKIEEWRKKKSLERTKKRRPDLLK
jgi:tRNA (guanine37-N1)-methyltransferase